MKSQTPKVLHNILGRSMLRHVLDAVAQLCPVETVVVADPELADKLASEGDIRIAVQKIPLGTADAAAVGVDALSSNDGDVLVLNGDVPLLRAASLSSLVDHQRNTPSRLTIATFQAPANTKYGRVDRRNEQIRGIVEAVEDRHDRSAGFEANGGLYCFDLAWLTEHIGNVRVSGSGEYFITSLVEMAARDRSDSESSGAAVASVALPESELLGVDDRARLAQAEAFLRERVIDHHLAAGVTIVDPARTVIEPDVVISADARIEPGCFIRGQTTIGSGTTVGPYSVIENSMIGSDCEILQSWLDQATVADNVRIGPFSRLRPGTVIEQGVFIGNFVETKATTVGRNSQVHHVTYLGDAQLGSNVNVGAGTITCNYDGVSKHRTIIGNDVFVGCDTMLVAPVELGDNSRTGAGAVVTRSVPAGQTVVGVPARDIAVQRRPKVQEEHGR